MKLTYIIGRPEDAFRKRGARYATYMDAVFKRPGLDYDVLYVFKGKNIVCIIALEELYKKFCNKPYRGSFKFHERMECLLRFMLKGHS